MMKKIMLFLVFTMFSVVSVFGQTNKNYQSNYKNSDNLNVISIRPLSMLFKQPNIKYERSVSPDISVGGELTYFTGLNSGLKIDPFVRFYTGQNSSAPQGFYLQGKAMYGNHKSETAVVKDAIDEVETEVGQDILDINGDDRFSAWGAGFGVGSQWFVGANKNLSIDLYGGLKRYKASGNTFQAESIAFNTVRGWPVELKFSVGYAF